MFKKLLLLISIASISIQSFPQKSSFIVLGDIHYDLPEDHDMEWLGTKPDDLRQVTTEYTVFTQKYWKDFVSVLQDRVKNSKPAIKAIIQAGDLSEGLAGNPEKALRMASHAIKAVDDSNDRCTMDTCKRQS